jgi:transposase-like protein
MLDAQERRRVRHWRSISEKRQIVQLTLEPGARVAEVARAHGVNANQVFTWRRAFERGELSEPSKILKQRKEVNFARLDEKDLPGLLQAIEVYKGTPLARLGMKLMAYTLLRTGELINLQWTDVCLDCGDADAPKITIPR